MGYSKPLNKLSYFRRNRIPGMWNQLHGVLAKSLSPQATGLDKSNQNFLQIFHAFCYHRHVDYVLLLWNDMGEAVYSKYTRKPKTYIPYVRFLHIMIDYVMITDVGVTNRSLEGAYQSMPIKFQLKVGLEEGERQMDILLKVLKVVDQDDPDVRAYRRLKYPIIDTMVQQPQVSEPAQEVRVTESEVRITETEFRASEPIVIEYEDEPKKEKEKEKSDYDDFGSMPGHSSEYDSSDDDDADDQLLKKRKFEEVSRRKKSMTVKRVKRTPIKILVTPSAPPTVITSLPPKKTKKTPNAKIVDIFEEAAERTEHMEFEMHVTSIEIVASIGLSEVSTVISQILYDILHLRVSKSISQPETTKKVSSVFQSLKSSLPKPLMAESTVITTVAPSTGPIPSPPTTTIVSSSTVPPASTQDYDARSMSLNRLKTVLKDAFA